MITRNVLPALQIRLAPSDQLTEHKTWLKEVFKNLDDRGRKLLTISFWAIWCSKNKFIHDGIRHNIIDLVGFILGYLTEIETL